MATRAQRLGVGAGSRSLDVLVFRSTATLVRQLDIHEMMEAAAAVTVPHSSQQIFQCIQSNV
jgi:hypothetical protein